MRIHIFALAIAAAIPAAARTYVETPAYIWSGDTIIQGSFRAFAPSDTAIVTNYHGQPGYFMPAESGWTLRNDISRYPRLRSDNRLHNAVYTMALDEMINAVEPDTTLRTGREWAGVWTRDVSYSILLSMAYMQPEAARISLEHKITSDGRIVQDTGSGGAWPISSDRLIWLPAALEIYRVTGDRDWARRAYAVGEKTLADDAATVRTSDGRVRGETSFIDWREQSYPRWMQTADIYSSQASGTSVVAAMAHDAMAEFATALGRKADARRWKAEADSIKAIVNTDFWIPAKGHYGMYRYGRINPILHPASETLGQSLAVLSGTASPEQARELTAKSPVTPFGAPVFAPQIADMPPYHNKALWPFVASFWTLANASAGNDLGAMQGLGSIVRPAALFATNKENLRIDNGDIATELNSSNMLWSLAGNIALTTRMLFGLNFEPDGIRIRPFVPRAMAGTRTLEGFRWRGRTFDITVSGYGSEIKSLTLNGRKLDPSALITEKMLRPGSKIDVVMADNTPALSEVNMTKASAMPLMPEARLVHDPDLTLDYGPTENLLRWRPVEYAAGYEVLRDGVPVAVTRRTSWPANTPGEWQVRTIAADSLRSFASEPLTNLYEQRAQPRTTVTTPVSAEITYAPATPVAGWSGYGFAETDHANPEVVIPFSTDAPGRWAITVRYANGNGPVNTENKAAIRTLFIDGRDLGTVVMPQRGVANWDDWGDSNTIVTDLPAGEHTATLRLVLPQNENMNRPGSTTSAASGTPSTIGTNHALIDRLTLRRLSTSR